MMRTFFGALLLLCSSATWAGVIDLGQGAQPRVASNGGNDVAVAFGRPDAICVAVSRDGGVTFEKPHPVATVIGMPLGMRRGPRIAFAGDVLVLSAIEATHRGEDDNIWTCTSSDDGKTWTRSAAGLSSLAGSVREGLHNIAANSHGVVACVWLDLRNASADRSGTEIWMNLSTDAGRSWQQDRVVYRNPGGTVCECCHPSVVIDDAGRVSVMFRNVVNGSRDMYLTTSDDGKTFTPARKLGDGSWPLKVCPMDGGDLAIRADRSVVSTWKRDGTVFQATPGRPEVKISTGAQPVLAVAPKGQWRLWTAGRALMEQDSTAPPREIAADAAFPSIAACNDHAVAAWEHGQSINAVVLPAGK